MRHGDLLAPAKERVCQVGLAGGSVVEAGRYASQRARFFACRSCKIDVWQARRVERACRRLRFCHARASAGDVNVRRRGYPATYELLGYAGHRLPRRASGRRCALPRESCCYTDTLLA